MARPSAALCQIRPQLNFGRYVALVPFGPLLEPSFEETRAEEPISDGTGMVSEARLCNATPRNRMNQLRNIASLEQSCLASRRHSWLAAVLCAVLAATSASAQTIQGT